MGHDVSTITAGGIVFTICLGVFLLVLPRRYALAPLFISGCYMTLGQVLLIGPFHFTIFRILILVGLMRVVFRKEILGIKLNTIDKILVIWVVISSAFYIMLRGGSSESIIYRLGATYNIIGLYFLIRALIWDFEDIVQAVRMLSIIIIPLALLFVLEWTTGRNLFSIFGGVSEFTAIRDGRLRCQGPFQHPIMSGTFGATAMPILAGLWAYNPKYRGWAAGAVVAATIIVITSTSSGPLLAYLMTLIGFASWVFRENMRSIRWGIVLSLLALHIVMKAPVWYLIARVGELIGGGGWHRSALINAAIQHFNEWWLIGTTYTANWMPTGLAIDPNNTDITNQYIGEGVNGGLLSLCLFIWLIVKCFKAIGDTIHNEVAFSRPEQIMVWSIGCALFGHVVSFLSASYFDQIIIFWYLIIAMSATLLELNASVWTILVAKEAGSLIAAESSDA